MVATRGMFLWSGLVLVLAGCATQPADQSAAAAEEIRAADIAWEKVFTAMDTSGALAFIEPSGSMLAPNVPIATGHDAIQSVITGFYSLPDMKLHWQVTKAEASTSGDLGYSTGTYDLSFNGPNGEPVVDHGKYLTVWRKQADGSWKVVQDIFNSDLPAPGT